MEKKSERINVLTEGNNKNLVHAIVNAVSKGYSDNIIIDDILDLVRTNEVSQGVLSTCPQTLRSYSESISSSLNNIADEVEGIKIQQQEMVVERKKRFEEFEKKEDDKNFEETQEKTSSCEKISITENWEKTEYNENENKLAGVLLINFNQDMSFYKRSSTVSLGKSVVDYVNNKIFAYLKKEYPQLKAQLTDKIFKSQIEFCNVKIGKCQINFEIEGAFKK
jgi:predicted nuclease with TOPRIM domain